MGSICALKQVYQKAVPLDALWTGRALKGHFHSSSPQGQATIWRFPPTCSMLRWGEGQWPVRGWQLKPSLFFTAATNSTLSCYMLRFRQHRNQFLKQPLESLNITHIHVPVFHVPSPGEARSWEFLLTALGWATWEGIWQVSALYFPPCFDISGFTLAWGVGASELFSRLLTEGIDPCIVELISPGGGEWIGSDGDSSSPICSPCVYFKIF